MSGPTDYLAAVRALGVQPDYEQLAANMYAAGVEQGKAEQRETDAALVEAGSDEWAHKDCLKCAAAAIRSQP